MNIVKTISNVAHEYETSQNNKIALSCAYVIANTLENENDLKNLEKLVKIACLDLNDLETLNNTSQRGSGTLFCIYKFSMYSRAKSIIYDESYETLKKFVDLGDAREHFYALKTLTQLGFSQNLANKMNEDREFLKLLKKLVNHGETQEVKNLSEILLWSLRNKHAKHKPNKPPSVYISFSISQSKELVKKIASRLDIKGIKVKNVEFIQKDFVEFDKDMAHKLILKSDHILVCISERYRMSPRCQAEALMSLEAGKHVLALIVQEGFEANEMRSGWLGSLTSNENDFISFSNKKYFEKSMETLLGHLLGRLPELSGSKRKEVEKWTHVQVHEWLLINEINPHICELYKNVNGLTLKEIHVINVENSEFFYECLNKETNFKIDKVDYEVFSQKMRNLFSKTNE